MITDGAQSVDTNAMAMIRSGWTRVRQGISLVYRTEEDVGHFAILSDDLVCGQAKSGG